LSDGDGIGEIDRAVPAADEVKLVPPGEDTAGALTLGP